MEISALLSQETPADDPPSQSSSRSSPARRPARLPTRKSASLLQQQQQQQQHQQLHSAAEQYHQQQQYDRHASPHPTTIPTHPPLSSSPSFNGYQGNGRAVHSASTTPMAEIRSPLHSMRDSRTPLSRQASTPGMDTLADLASMQQHHQSARQNFQSHRAPSVSLQNLPRSLSSNSVKEAAMADVPHRSFFAASLLSEDSQTLKDLALRLAENSYDYEAHISFVNTLRKGLVDPILPADYERAFDPTKYELLGDLRQARISMDSKFPVGEDLWLDWIKDELLLARTIDDRVSVMELCSKAALDEPNSTALWRLYGDVMYLFWAAANDKEESDWSEEDRLVGKEVFNWDSVMEVWQQGTNATQFRLNDSHIVWDRWLEILGEDLARHYTVERGRYVRKAFTDRLLKPHRTWEQTCQAFSSFLSNYDPNSYEETMVLITRQAQKTKGEYALRELFEDRLANAIRTGDRAAEWTAFSEYLDWERRTHGALGFNQINALYQRATIRFGTDPTFWEDYVEFLIELPDRIVPLIPVLERATRHCPWSGSLWSHRILTLEAEGKDFGDIETVKHNATESGLLDLVGLEELLKVYVAWSGFLRRRAFSGIATEDEVDVAEVGIRSALEHVEKIGVQKFGGKYCGDPHYRLERIHIKFYTQKGDMANGRLLWTKLIERQKNSYDFWYRYYIWEMIMWSRFVTVDSNNRGQDLPTPRAATMLLREALNNLETLDWPEQLIQMFTSHCEQHESVTELRSAIIESRKANKIVALRRAREAAEAQSVAAAQMHAQAEVAQTKDDVSHQAAPAVKRKWDSEAQNADENAAKKARSIEPVTGDPGSSTASNQLKRDREHTSVIVRNLPQDATEDKVKQFFRGCGVIQRISLVAEDDVQIATVEFETAQDALYAQSRSSKPFDGHEVEVSIATGSTLWVSNYPAVADEAYIRNLFKEVGEVVEVRFPSLSKNTHRRFCYVQFATPSEALSATQLDGTKIDEEHNLIAKISDPTLKQDRHGAVYESREVIVKNLSFKIGEEALESLFLQHGSVERVKILRKMDGRSMGTAFVNMKSKEHALASVAALHDHEVHGRKLNVAIAEPKGFKNKATTVINSASPEPSPVGSTSRQPNGNASKLESVSSEIASRTIALMNIPDTINDARIRALVEPIGALRKISLVPEHQGAIIEFVEVASVGKASLELAHTEIAPGRVIKVGPVRDLKMWRAENRSDKIQTKRKPKDLSTHPASIPASFAPRASMLGAAGSRRGGKGGVGVRRGGGIATGGVNRARMEAVTREEEKAIGADAVMGEGSTSTTTKAKSNADFKKLFLSAREKAANTPADDKSKPSAADIDVEMAGGHDSGNS